MIDKHIVLIAEGKNDPDWRMNFEILTMKLRFQFGENRLSLAYMNGNSPTLKDIVDKSTKVRNGSCELRILPMLLSSSYMTDNRLSSCIDDVLKDYPNIKLTVLPPLGEHPKAVTACCSIIRDCLI